MYEKQTRDLISLAVEYLGSQTNSIETNTKLEQIEDVLNDLNTSEIWNYHVFCIIKSWMYFR